MKELKKIAAIGGAVVLVACWPLAVGQIAQNVLTDGANQLNNGDYSVEIISYDRGYLSAQAVTRYSVNDPQLKEQLSLDGLPTEFEVEHDIKHGLLRIAAESRLVDVPDVPLTLTTTTQLNGNTEFSLLLDKVNYSLDDDQGAIYISKSTIEGNATVLGQLDFNYDFPSIQLAFSNNEHVSFSNMTGSVSGKKVNQFWHGEQSLNIETISMMTGQGETLASAKDIRYKFSSNTNEGGDRIETNHLLSTGEITSSDGQLQQLQVDFSLGGLDLNSFESLVSTYQNNPVITEQVLAESAPQIDALFEKGFYLAMNKMQFNLVDGQFDSQWRLEIPEGMQSITQDINQLIPQLTGNLDTYISNGLADAYPFVHQGIDELLVMEYMFKADDGYRMDAEIANGNLQFASGEKIPLIALLMSGMAN